MIRTAEPLSADCAPLKAYFEGSEELSRTLAGVLDIRTVFPRVSEIARKMLPHDALTMTAHDEHLNLLMRAASSDDLPDLAPESAGMPFGPELLVGDLTTEKFSLSDSPGLRAQIDAAGYRSLLRVVMHAGGGVLGVGFWSKQPNAYERRHVPLARRIVDHLALGVSHERLAKSASFAAQQRVRTERRPEHARADVPGLSTPTCIVGESAEWQEVLRKASRVASTDTTVLLTGESGTGKEVVARFIHRTSTRSNGPFVALNCAAMPEQLLEAELFGYERGAFTGADHAKAGHIESASRGVLFLDEVSEMSLSAQAKFLRVLQEREFRRLGGIRPLPANIRLIAATNRNLLEAVAKGDFRQDLFYRLRVFDVRIPPLRERPADILPLSESLLQEIGSGFGRPPARLSRATQQVLLEYDWPGNVRELRNALERAVILCDGGPIAPDHLGLQVRRPATATTPSNLVLLAREAIAHALEDCGWNKSRAARRLGLTRTELYSRIRKYGLEPRAPVSIA